MTEMPGNGDEPWMRGRPVTDWRHIAEEARDANDGGWLYEQLIDAWDALATTKKERDEGRRMVALLRATEMTELRRAKAARDELVEAADKLYTAHAPAEPGHPLWDALRDALDFAEGKS